jgi:hypothetical protein
MRKFLVLALLCVPAACLAQDKEKTVSPGMSEAQVVQALGKPATRRAVGERTYLFYANSCGRSCGMNDLVVLARDSVVDAIFRSPERHYTGTSSSPGSVSPRKAARATPSTTPMRMKPPEKANDASPSIPVAKPVIKPAADAPAPPKTP